MSTSWDSLYLPSADSSAVAKIVQQALNDLGYTLYNPFGILPGKTYPQTVRLFVAPSVGGWVRIIGTPDSRLLMPLSAASACLYIGLQGSSGTLAVYVRGDIRDPEIELQPYLRAGCTPDDLRRALRDHPQPAARQSAPPLPADVQDMAAQVNPRQAQQLIDRLSSNLLTKAGAGGTSAQAARALLDGPDWNSPTAQRIQAIVACLTLPDTWREPDFVTLRDAYQLHDRRQRKPDARLYPGDAETLARVPDALAYIPIYGGRET
jgi:hypothetical protein